MSLPADPDPSTLSGHVIVCGLGHVGYRIVCLLVRLGERGVVIARQASESWRRAAEPHFSVLLGDARDEQLLRRAGIERAKAVLVVTDDDLANVSIALDARRLNPGVAITVRLFDQELAAHFESCASVNRALSTSALAVPAFMAAALGDTVRGAFEAEGTCWTIREAEIASDSAAATIGQWARPSGRAPIALRRGEETTLMPGPDAALLPGDRLTFVVPAACAEEPCAAPARTTSEKMVSAARAFVPALVERWRNVPTALRTAVLVLSAVVLLSVGVFHFAMDLSLVDSLYFVITTITTVGYGDISLKDAPLAMKLYGSFLMLCGAAILAAVFSILTDFILQTRLRDVMAADRARSTGHVIVAGLGKIGFRLVRDLVRNGQRVVAIERREDAEFVQTARELAPVVLGNAKAEETLLKAGAAGAKAVIAATDDDLANLSIALAAKRARADCRVVLRIFDSTLAEKMEQGLGVDAVLSVSAAAAPTFLGSVLCPDVLQGMVLCDHLVLVFHRTVQSGPPGAASSAASLGTNEAALLVKPAGASAYRPVDADYRPRQGDRVLGASWRRLSTGG